MLCYKNRKLMYVWRYCLNTPLVLTSMVNASIYTRVPSYITDIPADDPAPNDASPSVCTNYKYIFFKFVVDIRSLHLFWLNENIQHKGEISWHLATLPALHKIRL